MTPTKVSQDSHIIVICYASTLKTKQILVILGEILQFNSQAPATHALSFLHTYLVSFSILIYTLQGGIYISPGRILLRSFFSVDLKMFVLPHIQYSALRKHQSIDCVRAQTREYIVP